MKVYHLALDDEKIKGAKHAIIPGDPERVGKIAKLIDPEAREIASKREYRTFLANTDASSVLVTSTGIGGPSASIAIDELAQLGVRTFIRVGTTGAIQEHIEVGDVIITSAAVRLDGASTHYAPVEYPAVAHHEVLFALVDAAKKASKEMGFNYHVGITVSADTFYPGQERYDSYSKYVIRRFQNSLKEWRKLNALNYEMESSTVLTLCSALNGLRGGCVTGVVVNRTKEEKIDETVLEKAEENAIAVAVEAIKMLGSRGE